MPSVYDFGRLRHPDQPFKDDVYYGDKFDEYGAVPSMLNFGSTAKLSPGESLYDAKTTKITKIKASTLADSLKNSTFLLLCEMAVRPWFRRIQY